MFEAVSLQAELGAYVVALEVGGVQAHHAKVRVALVGFLVLGIHAGQSGLVGVDAIDHGHVELLARSARHALRRQRAQRVFADSGNPERGLPVAGARSAFARSIMRSRF